MSRAAGNYEQVPYAVRMCNTGIYYIKDNPYGIENTPDNKPGKSG
jgi:hypothetical protein